MKNKIHIIFILIILISTSCTVEKNLALNYVNKKGEKKSVLIMVPDNIFKTNLKTDILKDSANLSESEKDSILFYSSKYLQNISDSIFLENYVNSLIQEFNNYNFDVYLSNSIDSFLTIKTPAYIINLAQIEFEEDKIKFKDHIEYYDGTFYKTINLNALNINTWFDITKLNDKSKKGIKTLYNSSTVTDKLDGVFVRNLLTYKVRYKYTLSEMKIDDIYKFAIELGKKHVSYFYDYLINDFIKNNLSKNIKQEYFYHYDKKNNKLTPITEDENMFIEM